MDYEIKDEKLNYLVKEVMEFYEFINAVGQQFTQETFAINQLEVAKLIGDFYEKNSNKYNNTQLVYQFILFSFKRDKDVMKMFKAFKRVQADMQQQQ